MCVCVWFYRDLKWINKPNWTGSWHGLCQNPDPGNKPLTICYLCVLLHSAQRVKLLFSCKISSKKFKFYTLF